MHEVLCGIVFRGCRGLRLPAPGQPCRAFQRHNHAVQPDDLGKRQMRCQSTPACGGQHGGYKGCEIRVLTVQGVICRNRFRIPDVRLDERHRSREGYHRTKQPQHVGQRHVGVDGLPAGVAQDRQQQRDWGWFGGFGLMGMRHG